MMPMHVGHSVPQTCQTMTMDSTPCASSRLLRGSPRVITCQTQTDEVPTHPVATYGTLGTRLKLPFITSISQPLCTHNMHSIAIINMCFLHIKLLCCSIHASQHVHPHTQYVQRKGTQTQRYTILDSCFFKSSTSNPFRMPIAQETPSKFSQGVCRT